MLRISQAICCYTISRPLFCSFASANIKFPPSLEIFGFATSFRVNIQEHLRLWWMNFNETASGKSTVQDSIFLLPLHFSPSTRSYLCIGSAYNVVYIYKQNTYWTFSSVWLLWSDSYTLWKANRVAASINSPSKLPMEIYFIRKKKH